MPTTMVKSQDDIKGKNIFRQVVTLLHATQLIYWCTLQVPINHLPASILNQGGHNNCIMHQALHHLEASPKEPHCLFGA